MRAERFEREADRVGAERNGTLATIQRDTAIAWLETFYIERLRTAVSEQLTESRLEIEAVQGAYRGARASQADVLAAQSSRRACSPTAFQSSTAGFEERARHARALGRRRRRRRHARRRTFARLGAAACARLDEQDLAAHPNIAVLTQEVGIAESEAALARANKRADWSWELAYQKRGTDFSDMVSIGVSIPLQWNQGNRQDREVAAKLAHGGQSACAT